MNVVMLIDAEFLRQEAHNVLGIERNNMEIHHLTAWMHREGFTHIRWYDGIYKVSDPRYNAQRHWLDGMAEKAGMKLRLGTIIERDNSLYERAMYRMLPKVATDLNLDADALERSVQAHWESRTYRQQKGVDALLILDMLRLAQSGNVGVICLCAGDTDFVPAIHEAQQCGVPVNAVVPRPHKLSPHIKRTVDASCVIPKDVLEASFNGKVR